MCASLGGRGQIKPNLNCDSLATKGGQLFLASTWPLKSTPLSWRVLLRRVFKRQRKITKEGPRKWPLLELGTFCFPIPRWKVLWEESAPLFPPKAPCVEEASGSHLPSVPNRTGSDLPGDVKSWVTGHFDTLGGPHPQPPAWLRGWARWSRAEPALAFPFLGFIPGLCTSWVPCPSPYAHAHTPQQVVSWCISRETPVFPVALSRQPPEGGL